MGSAYMIAAAVTATERVQEEVLKTSNALNGFCSGANASAEQLERVQGGLAATTWPTAEDYDEV